ncbi:transposase [Gemelliphila palaticanis]|uniref:Transposase n=1 Tax=Gemelliphila palaticanis TaxID=81950 RepID=A0ABX2SZ62_9BACL|nr:transposase [Gemella palaticanis]MBF0714717.1 transposase [Gemella palaticanis]NYS46647.1 transposase [Gemella palaticanis]
MYNYIKEILEIKDKNIEITGEIRKEKIKGQTTFVVEGKLTYDIEYCHCCGCKNEKHTVIKDGFLNTEIKMLRISEKPTKLKLKKQRYKCKNCERKFTAETKIVDKYCQISKILKVTLLSNLKEIKSNKTIAKEQYISESTVIRILQGARKYLETNKYKNLPEYLCFDEIQSTKDAENKMSFVYADAQTGNLIDIVDGRTYKKLKNYFIAIPRKIRKKVKTICIDIYPPYMKLIKEIFPKAEIIDIS